MPFRIANLVHFHVFSGVAIPLAAGRNSTTQLNHQWMTAGARRHLHGAATDNDGRPSIFRRHVSARGPNSSCHRRYLTLPVRPTGTAGMQTAHAVFNLGELAALRGDRQRRLIRWAW